MIDLKEVLQTPAFAKQEKQLQQTYPTAIWHFDGFNKDEAKHDGKSGIVLPHIVVKPWGFEIWKIFTNVYAWKELVIMPGEAFSLQYHEYKTETWVILAGYPIITLQTNTQPKEDIITGFGKPGEVIHIAVGTIHQISCPVDALPVVIEEVSTSELNDVVHLQDKYGRP